jgi:hypothetical protein
MYRANFDVPMNFIKKKEDGRADKQKLYKNEVLRHRKPIETGTTETSVPEIRVVGSDLNF